MSNQPWDSEPWPMQLNCSAAFAQSRSVKNELIEHTYLIGQLLLQLWGLRALPAAPAARSKLSNTIGKMNNWSTFHYLKQGQPPLLFTFPKHSSWELVIRHLLSWFKRLLSGRLRLDQIECWKGMSGLWSCNKHLTLPSTYAPDWLVHACLIAQ